MPSYLIFERTNMTFEGNERRLAMEGELLTYVPIGGIIAPTPDDACQIACRATRRVSAFAAIEAEFIDFTVPVDQADGEPRQLNP